MANTECISWKVIRSAWESRSKERSYFPKSNKEYLTMTFSIQAIVSLLAGVLILMVPRALNYIVAVYLILVGIIGLLNI
jgi:hypothetical protein